MTTNTATGIIAGQSKVPGSSQSGGGPRHPARQLANEQEPTVIGDWLIIEPDGSILVLAGKADVGQGIRTSLAQIVAEEMRLPLERVHTYLGDTAYTPFDMGTFGSRTTPILSARLREIAVSARQVLVDRAARRWGVPGGDTADINAEGGQVIHTPSGRSISYFDLLEDAEEGRLEEHWSEDVPVTPPEQWKTAGRPTLRSEEGAREFVTGRHRYTTDMVRPRMVTGGVLRPPVLNANLVSIDTKGADAIPGVEIVHDGNFVGVVGPDRYTVRRALAAIQAEWDFTEVPQQTSGTDLFTYLKSHPAPPQGYHRWDGPEVFEVGSVEIGRGAGLTLQATYTLPYIAHAPLETRAAVAEWGPGEGGDVRGDEQLTVWTGTQRPFGVRAELAAAFELPEWQVRVIVPDTGSAYGGKHTGDAAIEAARLARAVGRPVKVVWSREEEFTWAYFRPAGLIEISSAVADEGIITAWEYHNYNSGPAAIRPPYEIDNQLVAFHTTRSPLRQGSYRALAATANHFAREGHIDELAHLVGMDPLEIRLRNLKDERLRAVLMAATERFGWRTRRLGQKPGHGFGLACGTEKGSFIAMCAEVAVIKDEDHSKIKVIRVVAAFECGAIVNPLGLTNQVEGAIVQALGGALFEQIEFGEGKILSDRFSRYRVPRFSDFPEIETVLLNRPDLPSAGAGETPIVGLAPALANAIFDAAGVRLRDLPLSCPRSRSDPEIERPV